MNNNNAFVSATAAFQSSAASRHSVSINSNSSRTSTTTASGSAPSTTSTGSLGSSTRHASVRATVWDALAQRIGQIKIVNALLALIGLITMIAAAEANWKNDNKPSLTSDALKIVTSITTFFLLLGILYRHYLEFKLLTARGSLLQNEGFLDSGTLPTLLLELLVCGIHCPAGVYSTFRTQNLGFELEYDFDGVLSVAALGRIYLGLQILTDAYGFKSGYGRVVEKYNKVRFDMSFSFRALLDRHPIKTVLSVFFVSTILAAYSLRVFERPACDAEALIAIDFCGSQTLGTKNYNSFAVAMWNVIITATTIGYGDVVALTHGGRFIILCTSLTGISIIALLVTAVANASQFKADERRAFDAFLKHKFALQRRKRAKQVIKFFLLFAANLRRHRNEGHMGKAFRMFRNSISGNGPSISTSSPREGMTTNPVFASSSPKGGGGNTIYSSPQYNKNAPLYGAYNQQLQQQQRQQQHQIPSQSQRKSAVIITNDARSAVPHHVIRGLAHALYDWRVHQREWHELTRDKDTIDLLSRGLVDVSTRVTESSVQTAAEIDRLTLHSSALAERFEEIIASLNLMQAQVSGMSETMKIPKTKEMNTATQKLDVYRRQQTWREQQSMQLIPSLEGSVSAEEFERKRREYERIVSAVQSSRRGGGGGGGSVMMMKTMMNSTRSFMSVPHMTGKQTVNGRPMHSRVAGLFRPVA